MGFFKRRGTSAAALERRPDLRDDYPGSTDELFAEIDRLTEANRAAPDRETERRLLWLRHYAGVRRVNAHGNGAGYAAPEGGALPAPRLPEIAAADVTPGLVRAGILRDGCLLVRGLVDRDAALRFAGQIDRAFAARAGEAPAEGYYEEFEPGPPVDLTGERSWVTDGGLWAADSPKLMFDMFEAMRRCGLDRVIAGYLGETAAISIQKCTMRKVNPD